MLRQLGSSLRHPVRAKGGSHSSFRVNDAAPEVTRLGRLHRLHFDQKTNVATVWNLDEEGWETSVVPEEQQYAVALPMINVLKAARGHIAPIDPVDGPDIPNQQVFQQLKSLGYLDKRE